MASRLGSAILDVEAERISERCHPEGREARYRLYVPSGSLLALESLREQAENKDVRVMPAHLAGDWLFAADVLYEDLGPKGDRRLVELDLLVVGTPGSHYWAYEISLEVAENAWGI